MVLGLSSGEWVFIAAAAAIAFGPKDVPVIARTAGRLAGRALGHLRSFRTTMGSLAERSEISKVHAELQQAMVQLEAIRHELRSGVSLSPPNPLTRTLPTPQKHSGGGWNVGTSHHSPTLVGGLGRQDTISALQHSSFQDGPSQKEASVAFTSSHREASLLMDGTAAVDSPCELAAAQSGLRSPRLSEAVGPDVPKQSTGKAARTALFGSGSSLAAGSLQDARTLESRSSDEATAQFSGPGHRQSEAKENFLAQNVLPISAVTAGLIPRNSAGTVSGSDILLHSLIEEEVASHAREFLKGHSPSDS